MRKIYFIIFNCIVIASLLAQQNLPSNFNIQFSLRKVNGIAAANKSIRVQTLIYDGSSNLIYNKVFVNLQTSAYGILSLNVIGTDNSNRNIPSAESFANNELFLQIKVDTIDVTSTIDNGLFEVYPKQKFASVPYAMAAQKAPGTFVYFDTPNDSIINNNSGINGDAAVVISPTIPNAFPKLYFNKKSNAWPVAAYSLLPNNTSNTFKTIFYNESGSSSNVKRAWEINNALTLNQKGIGINIPNSAPPAKALEVYGTLRFDTLKNIQGGNSMVAADQFGNVFTLPIPSVSGIPSGNQQGDMLYYNLASNAWLPTSLLQFKNNSLFVSNNAEIGDTIKGNVAKLNTSLFLNSLKNTSLLDTATYLSTDAAGRVVDRRINNFAWGIKGNAIAAFGSIPFIGTTDATHLIFKTNGNQIMKMYGQALGSTRLSGDVDIDNNLYILKNLSVANTVKFEANNYKNPAPLDSIRFLTTDGNGNLNLHKVKFPSIVGLPNGNAIGDMLYYTGGSTWGTTSLVQFKNSSLFVGKNINIGDTLLTKHAVVNFDLFLNNLKNNVLADTNLFLNTDANGKMVLRKFGTSLWGLQGNAISTLTNAPFIGTTDASDLILKTNSSLAMRIYGSNTTANRLNGDVEISKSLFVSKDLTVSTNVKFDAVDYKNPQPLDSTRFLTTDVNGNLKLHKVKFPVASGTLPSGAPGDLFFYNSGTWGPSSDVKIIGGSLFATKNVTVTDTLLASHVKVKDDIILSDILNTQFVDSSRFLTTDPTGKVVLQKVKIPNTIPVSSTIKTKYINVTSANQSYNLADTTRIYVNHISVNSGTYQLNLPLAVSFPNRSYEIYFSRGGPGLTADLQILGTIGFFDIFNFRSATPVNSYTDNSNDDLKITLTSTFISPILGYEWILIAENINW